MYVRKLAYQNGIYCDLIFNAKFTIITVLYADLGKTMMDTTLKYSQLIEKKTMHFKHMI